MKNMFAPKSKIFSAFIFITLFFVSPLTYAGCAPDLDKNVQKILDEGRVKDKIIGMQLSILCKGDMTPHDFVSGVTTKENGTAITADTLFQVGSITKSFTAALILKLEAQGILSINDEVGLWLPQIPDTWKKVTIKQLLNHTSGIADYALNPAFQMAEFFSGGQREWQPDELLQFVATRPVQFPAGEGYDYSNSNYVLAGMIIDVALSVQGKSYADAIKFMLIDPAHLTNTFYLPQTYDEATYLRIF